MRKKSVRKQWAAEVEDRQRNYVFPKTLENETEGYRRLYQSGNPLSTPQFVGFLLLIAALLISLAGFLWVAVFSRWTTLNGPWWEKLVTLLAPYAILFGGFAVPLVLMGISARRTLSKRRNRHSNAQNRVE
jgi:hypothetical protein